MKLWKCAFATNSLVLGSEYDKSWSNALGSVAWSRVHVDVVNPLKMSSGGDLYFDCDGLTRFALAEPVPSIDTHTICQKLETELFLKFGCPFIGYIHRVRIFSVKNSKNCVNGYSS